MKIIKPPKLRPGNVVGLISPSNSVVERKAAFERAIDVLEKKLHIKMVIAPRAMGREWYSSGTVVERLNDFHQMVLDPEVKAIWFTLGGNTAIDLVDKLDYGLIKDNPKIISGISDATTLLTAITAQTGLITFHGLELTDFGTYDMRYGLEAMTKSWFEGGEYAVEPNTNWHNFDGLPTSYSGWMGVKPGKAKGRLAGGNFTSFYQLLDTPYAMKFEQAIMVMETYRFKKRGIHQALQKLRLHGLFDQISGLILGYCLGSDDPEEYGDNRPMKELVDEVTEGYDFPVMWVGEIGHKVENILIPLGAEATMDADMLTLKIEAAVAA